MQRPHTHTCPVHAIALPCPLRTISPTSHLMQVHRMRMFAGQMMGVTNDQIVGAELEALTDPKQRRSTAAGIKGTFDEFSRLTALSLQKAM